MIHVELTLDPDPDYGGYTAQLPDLPVFGEGETIEEAVAELKAAVRAYIAAYNVESDKYRDWCQS